MSAAAWTIVSNMAGDLSQKLRNACADGRVRSVQSLIRRGADIHSRDCYEWTPLHYTYFMGHTDTVLLLLGRGADVTSRDIDGVTPLHCACQRGHIGTALALVRAGADTLATDYDDETPLNLIKSEELKAALIREREKYLAWTRRKAFMMFLVGYRYIAMSHHQPQAAAGQKRKEPLADKVMRVVNMTIASFL